MVHTLPPKREKTFEDYGALDVLPTIHAYAMMYKSTHIVFDAYNPSSLNMETRSKRDQEVTSKNKVQTNWRNFLRHNDNKTDLFHFLADKIPHMTVPNYATMVTLRNPVFNFLVSCSSEIGTYGLLLRFIVS